MKQEAQRAMIAHPRAIINLLALFRRSMTAYSTVSGPISLKFELIKDIMYVHIECRFKKYQVNSNREKEETSFLDTQGQLTM